MWNQWTILKAFTWLSIFLIRLFDLYLSIAHEISRDEPPPGLKVWNRVSLHSISIDILYVLVCLLFLPIWFYSDLVRLSQSGTALQSPRRVADWRRWRDVMLDPPRATHVIIAVAVATMLASGVSAIWYIPAAAVIYFTMVIVGVADKKDPKND